MIYAGDQDGAELFFRVLLFKIFNRIGTWELLREDLGPIEFRSYSFDQYDAVLTRAMERGQRLFSAAYIMPAGTRQFRHERKHRNYLRLLELMLESGAPARLTAARSMGEAFAILRAFPLMGDFLAYQYLIDLNYGAVIDFSESEFVVAGPGARDGIRKCFEDVGGLKDERVIQLVAERQDEEFERLGLHFQHLGARKLQLIDCQNLFCEVDKYARVVHPEISGKSGRSRIKQTFRSLAAVPTCWLPPKWGVNEAVSEAIARWRTQSPAAEQPG